MQENPNNRTTANDFIPFKIAPLHGGSEPPSNTWFLGPTQVNTPNGVMIGLATFAGLTVVTDRPTHHTTLSVAIGSINAALIIVS